MAKDTPSRAGTDPAKNTPHKEDEPLQARGPDPRNEPPSDDGTEGTHGKPAGGPHHDKTPRVLVKQVEKHNSLEKGRPTDTGRAGA